MTINCIGGEMYHDLGMQFTSPTINLFFRADDFIKIAEHPKEYLMQKLEFIEETETYPVAMLKDAKVHFLHYKTSAEAAGKWYERIERIDFDNLYIIADDCGLDDDTFKRFQNVTECRRKIMFTTSPERAQYKDVYRIYKDKPYSYVSNYAVKRSSGYYDFEKFFDFVAWLSGKDDFMMM